MYRQVGREVGKDMSDERVIPTDMSPNTPQWQYYLRASFYSPGIRASSWKRILARGWSTKPFVRFRSATKYSDASSMPDSFFETF